MDKYVMALFYTLMLILCAESKALEIDHIGTKTLSATETAKSANSNDSLRYENLMKGSRGKLSPNIDQLTALGIEARNDAERRHYAELWVKQEYERTEKELKFQREVDAAWKRLMPNMLPVNMGNAAGIAHDSGGRLALFVRETDCQRCDARLSAVLADKRPVDIYLVDSEGNDQKLATGHSSTAFPPSKFASAVSP